MEFGGVKHSFCAAIVSVWLVGALEALCDLLIELNALFNTLNMKFSFAV